MDEYIKREDAIEAMYKVSDKCVWIPFWNEQLLALEGLPAADVLPVKWIPVTERLPNIGEKVITYCKGYGVKENFRSGDGTWWVGFKITHWMPLPEPPKEDEDE